MCIVEAMVPVLGLPRKIVRSVSVVLLIYTACVILNVVERYTVGSPPSSLPKHSAFSADKQLKSILFWSSAENYWFGLGHKIFVEGGCPVNTCYTSEDKYSRDIEEWSAIVFQMGFLPREIPEKRHANQRYVFFNLESPIHLYKPGKPYRRPGFFNWTFTYRSDSDIPSPYGRLIPTDEAGPAALIFPRWLREEPYVGPNVAKNKTKKVAWFVSHCKADSRRDDLAKALSRHIPVDIYGKCGSLSCDRNSWKACQEMVDQDYKFYLSFENSICQDYATEKLFNMVQTNYVIPVVYGGANYSSMMPPHSYVDASEFKTTKELAGFLYRLDADDELYNSYFWWKMHYSVTGSGVQRGFCKLCEMLHSNDEPEKSYEDIVAWWWREGRCRTPAESRWDE